MAVIFKWYDIALYEKLIKTAGSLLVHQKDKTDTTAKCGVVFDMPQLSYKPQATSVRYRSLVLDTGHQC